MCETYAVSCVLAATLRLWILKSLMLISAVLSLLLVATAHAHSGGLVTLLNFVVPEWETLNSEPTDRGEGWVHPTFLLSRDYNQ
jgi:hypothetical protein